MAITDFDYTATRNEIIYAAFRIVGAIEPGEVLSSEMLDQGVKALQLLVKSWSNKNLFLWSFNQSSFSTAANDEIYDTELDQSLMGVDKVWYVDNNDDIQIRVVTYSEYLDIRTKSTQTGRPYVAAFKPTPAPSLYLWPKPDAIYSMKLLGVVPLKDMDTASGIGDIPAEYQRALKYGLAEDLFDEYPGPMNERQYIQSKAEELFGEAKAVSQPFESEDEIEGLYDSRC